MTIARVGGREVETRAPLDVDVFGAERQGFSKQPAALLFRPTEVAAFPRGPTRDDHRPASVRQCAGNIWIGNRVEAQLDQVGVGRLVAPLAEFRQRRRRHGQTEQRHKKSLFNRSG